MKTKFFLFHVLAIYIVAKSIIPLVELITQFPLNDFSVYIDGTKATLAGQNPYRLWFFDRYNYPPFATIIFVPLTIFTQNASEYIFTVISIISLWHIITYVFLSMKVKLPWSWKLLLFALALRLFPVRLTLVLGQINLIILLLIIASFYYQHQKPHVSGALLALASAIKLTPAPLLIYFLLKKNYRAISSFVIFTIVVNVIAIIVFGFPLTNYYYTQVLPELNSRVTQATLNATYMNQSISALLGRFGVFGTTNAIIRYIISGSGVLFLFFQWKKLSDLQLFSSLLIIATLFLPVFVWQHHFIFVLPAWLILSKRNWLAGIIAYLALDFHFQNSGTAAVAHPFLATHFLMTTALLTLLVLFSETLVHTRAKT